MWKPFNVAENLYMIRLEKNENYYDLWLTDLTFVWKSQFSTESLVINFKNHNPLIEATNEQILMDFLEIIHNFQTENASSIKTDGVKTYLTVLKKCTEINDVTKEQIILYKFELAQMELEDFKNAITIPTIQTIYFLEEQQKMLLNLVQKKDRELEEFRMEKGEISRGDLKTDKFDPIVLNTDNEALMLNVFTKDSNKEFWNKFSEKNGEVQTSNLKVELEPWNSRPKKRVIHTGKKVVKKGSGVMFKN